MGIEIRQATTDDAQQACELLRRSIEEGCAADHGRRADILQSWLGNKTTPNLVAWFSAPSNYAVVAVDGERLAGLALLTQAGKLALCYVMPGRLQQGIGSAMVRALEERARCWDIARLHMHSPASSSGFFERLGYVNAGKDKACFGLECDFLWKQLNAAAPPASKRYCSCSGK